MLPRSLSSKALGFLASQAPSMTPKETACLESKKDGLFPAWCQWEAVPGWAGKQSRPLLPTQAVLLPEGSGIKSSVGTSS